MGEIDVLRADGKHRLGSRARDEFLRLFFDGTFKSDAENIERYFMCFAYADRAEHYAAHAGRQVTNAEQPKN